jgi:peptidoglycan hydrolase-like protein with peptidoglycan-binding domain
MLPRLANHEHHETAPGTVDRRSPAYIHWVQQALNQVSAARLTVDGAIGTRTRAAVRAFQSQRGLPADGVIGQRTEAALIAAGAPPPPGRSPAPAGRPPTAPTPGVLGSAVQQNATLARQLGWDVLYDAIASWILGFTTMTPSPETFARAVARWQSARNLPTTGVLDFTTWQPMLREAKRGIPSAYVTLEGVHRPHGIDAITAIFGDPTQASWESRNLLSVDAPAGQRFSGSTTRARVHRLIAPHFQRLFETIYRQGLWGELTPTWGTFNCRTKASNGKRPCGTPGINFRQLSTHSWGITIDMRSNDYPMITSASGTPKCPPATLTNIFQMHGFHWGLWFMNGNLTPSGRINFSGADPMHFQYATGY